MTPLHDLFQLFQGEENSIGEIFFHFPVIKKYIALHKEAHRKA